MTKVNRTMTSAFKKIREDCLCNNDNNIDTIRKLGNALLNMQQMSSRQAVHIILSLPLYSSSRKTVFINTTPLEKRTFVLKRPSQLQQEPDSSEDIMCASIIDRYIARPSQFEHICLAEYASSYLGASHHHKRRTRPCVIQFIRYNEHMDPENYYREKMMLYIPFRQTETMLKKDHTTWHDAYSSHKFLIDPIEKKFLPATKWGDVYSASEAIASRDE